MLITNLLKNAVAHGQKNGNISIEYQHPRLCVVNDGSPLPFSEDNLFTRFVRGSNSATSSGLGLEIASKICTYSSISISYSYPKEQHAFCVDFSKISA
jgi:signal transduction histidine kinase